jgi:hypothetical protein
MRGSTSPQGPEGQQSGVFLEEQKPPLRVHYLARVMRER